MSNEPQTQTLDETLNKTELGHVINENKNAILIAAAVVVAIIIGISIFKHQADVKDMEQFDQAYAFQSSVVEPFLNGTIDSAQAAQKIENLDSELQGSPNLAPSIFEVVGKLVKDGDMEKAISILEKWHSSFEAGSYLRYFAGLRLAPMLEDAGQADKAIAVYEGLVKGSHDLLEARVYLDLGRLYKEKGDSEKSKSFFEHVVKNHDASEEAKLAKLYLQELNK